MKVVGGTVTAGPHIRNACRRHLRDMQEGKARGLTWDLDAANRAIQFFPDVLRLAGGQFEGKVFELHPSQAFKTGSLFGWKRRDGTRRFRRAYVEEGKGNGKSPWAAGIGLYCLLADGEARAEVYAAASKRDQAMVLFRDAVAMREQSPSLKERLSPSGGNPVWNLADLKTGSFFRPIASDEGQSGPRPSCALCDEIHEHRDGKTIEMLERGFKWRRQPLLLMITNSGSDRNSVCWEEHEHAIKVAAGEVDDDSTFSFVCGLDEGDDPLVDPTCWIKSNPLLGATIQPGYLADVVAQAKALPGKLNNILRLHFCVWTDSETAWISRDTLQMCLDDFDPDQYAGEDVYGGIDLSGSQDLTALAMVIPTGTIWVTNPDDGSQKELPTFDAWVEAWTPRDTLAERSLRDKAPYDVWVRQGHLHDTPGKTIRMDYVAARVAEINADFRIKALAYDRYAYSKFSDELDDLGLTILQIEHPQGGKRRAKPSDEQIEAAKAAGEPEPEGMWMPGSLAMLEQLILERRIRIRSTPVIISACMSAAVEQDPFDNRWFSKRKATQRIDPLVALAMAVGAATAKSTEGGGNLSDFLNDAVMIG